MRRLNLGSSTGGVLCLIFGIWLLHQSSELDVETAARVGGGIGAADYPIILAVSVLVLALVLVLQGVFPRFAEEDDSDLAAPANATETKPSYARPALAFATLVLFTLLFNPVGYLIVTPIALVALMRINGEQRWGLMVVSAVAWTAVLFVLFRFGVSLVLPEGLLGDFGIVI